MSLLCLAMSPDGAWIVAGGRDNLVRVWNCKTGALVNTFQHHRAWIGSVCFVGTEEIASGDHAGIVHVWSMSSETPTHTIQTKVGWILSLSVGAQGHHMVVGGSNGAPEIHNLNTGESQPLEGHSRQAAIVATAMTNNDQYAVTGSEDRTIKIWQL